jgi:hypothetical protein
MQCYWNKIEVVLHMRSSPKAAAVVRDLQIKCTTHARHNINTSIITISGTQFSAVSIFSRFRLARVLWHAFRTNPIAARERVLTPGLKLISYNLHCTLRSENTFLGKWCDHLIPRGSARVRYTLFDVNSLVKILRSICHKNCMHRDVQIWWNTA